MKELLISTYQGVLSFAGAWALLYSGEEWNIYTGTFFVAVIGIGWAIPDRLKVIKMLEEQSRKGSNHDQ